MRRLGAASSDSTRGSAWVEGRSLRNNARELPAPRSTGRSVSESSAGPGPVTARLDTADPLLVRSGVAVPGVVHSKGAAMNQRNRQPFTRPSDRAQAPSAVRMIAPENVPGALTAAGRTSEPLLHEEPIVVRPEQFGELTDVIDHLRAGRAVLLLLEGFVDGAERRRGLAFVSGAAYALEITVRRSGVRKDAILLDPSAIDDDRAGNADAAAHVIARQTSGVRAPNVATGAGTCVLCDLRTADREFQPPLEMVIKRDGSRIWSPPATVCSHCRETIRHWKFALAWCSECERWGRRSVVSPCGHLYG